METIHNIPSYIRIEPYGRTVDVPVVAGASTVNVRAVAGDTLDFYFPKGYAYDLRTLGMFFRYFCLPYSTPKSGANQSLPKDTECMIQTLEVYLGGQKVNWIQNYNQVFFLMSLYGADSDFTLNRSGVLNTYTNGRASQIADLDGIQFCCEKWLGLLGLPIVLDTKKWGELVVKVTLAPAYITTSNSPLHSYGLSDIYMRVKCYSNYNGENPNHLEFDDFKSSITRENSTNTKNSLIVNSSKIDYALGRILRSDAFNKATIFAIGTGSVTAFGSVLDGPILRTWNFSVNNNNVFRYSPSKAEGPKTVLDLFKSRAINTNAQVTLVSATTNAEFDRLWACGADIGFVNEIPEQVEISFTTEGTGTGCWAVFIVKVTSSIDIGENGEVIYTP